MNIVFFASGNGSTFQALVEAIRSEQLPASPVLLVCSNAKAFALERAKNLDVHSTIVSCRDYMSTTEHASALISVLSDVKCDYIFLCGYLELVPPQVVAVFRNRILNIHPALLPAFGGKGMYGRHVHEAVIEYGAKVSGATVHFVDEEFDHGPILAQQATTVRPDDTPESLAARVQTVEKNLYVNALRLLVKGRVTTLDRKVTVHV